MPATGPGTVGIMVKASPDANCGNYYRQNNHPDGVALTWFSRVPESSSTNFSDPCEWGNCPGWEV